MSNIREYAKSVGFDIAGKLVRNPKAEFVTDFYTGEKVRAFKCYKDDEGNEYLISNNGVCICTADGGVI